MNRTLIEVSSIKIEVAPNDILACRICLACDVKLHNIRELKLDQTYVEIMGTTLSVWDGFPQYLCSFCCTLLMKSYELRTRCHRAEELLKQSLMHQHFITTDYIRSIDRKAHRLTHKLSSICSNAAVKLFTYQDEQPDTLQLEVDGLNLEADAQNLEVDTLNNEVDALHEVDEKLIDLPDDNLNDLKEFDLFSESLDKCEILPPLHCEFDTKISEVDVKFEDTHNVDDVKLVGVTEAAKPTPKRKRVKKTENAPKPKRIKTEETQEHSKKPLKEKCDAPKRRRKQKSREIPFETEEHFKPFEEKYNFKVIRLTDEEVLKEMEARKQSENYTHALKKCELCYKGFLSVDTYNNHMKVHDQARPYECQLCKRRYFVPAKLRLHMHTHQLKFLCLTCKENITSKAYAELHAAFHAGTTFKCKHCDMQFLKKTSRSTHARLAHPTENADGGTCELCGETFMSKLGLKSHKTRTHKQQPVLPRMRCRKCKVQFESIEAVEKHRNDQPSGTCDPNLSYCAQCGATFPNDDDVTQHRVSEHGLQLFTCDICSKTFTSKESLSTHMDRVHLSIKPKPKTRPAKRVKTRVVGDKNRRGYEPVCELCGKRVSCMATLKVHMNMHTGERPFKCNLCPKSYISRGGLMQHEAFHTQERKFRCPECPATFMHKSSIYQHMSIHRGEKSHRCNICNKTFTQSGSVNTHIRYVHMKITPPPRNRKKKTAA